MGLKGLKSLEWHRKKLCFDLAEFHFHCARADNSWLRRLTISTNKNELKLAFSRRREPSRLRFHDPETLTDALNHKTRQKSPNLTRKIIIFGALRKRSRSLRRSQRPPGIELITSRVLLRRPVLYCWATNAALKMQLHGTCYTEFEIQGFLVRHSQSN